jgi:rubrerythrin
MSKTEEDLKVAFAGESQANRRYLAYAKQADKESYPSIAKLFRAVAAAETVHAHNHFNAMGGVGSTAENLKAAIEGENYEATVMYPTFMADTEKEGEKRAHTYMKWAWEVEKQHEEYFRQALETLGSEAKEVEIYVCPVCGSTHIGARPEKCPVCGAPVSRFERIE